MTSINDLVRPYNRVRCISVGIACIDIEKRGLNPVKWQAIIPGGLSGDADVSYIIVWDGLLWEFEKRGESTRVYQYMWEEWKDSNLLRNYL